MARREGDPTTQPRDDSLAVGSEPAPQSGEYVVVARRYRPQTFDELIGQEQVARALTGAIAANRVGHAYLFTGARGVGKTSAARIMAKALDCQHGPSPTPCNQCDICQSIGRGSDVDVLEIDGASNRGIDEIRQLRQNVNIRPSRARFKIYIIDEVHMLTKEAFNALLKTLEEPPEHVKFIFCTTEAGKIPITILSRCQRFDFAGIRSTSIAGRLAQIVAAEGLEAEPEALALLARRANGSMRDSQSLLEQLLSFGQRRITAADIHMLLGTAADLQLAAIVDHLGQRNAAGALAELDTALAAGVEVGQLLEQLLGYFRDCMALLVGCRADALLYTTPGQQEQVLAVGRGLGLETVLAVVQIIDQALGRLRYSTQGRTLAEIALVRIASLENLDEVASLVAQIRGEASSNGPANGRSAPTASSASIGSAGPAKKKADLDAGPATETLPSRIAPVDLAPADDSQSSISHSIATAANDSLAHDDAPACDFRLSADNIPGIWREALGKLEGLVADYAGFSESVAISAPDRLAVTFPAHYNFQKVTCERPANSSQLEAALSSVVGRPIKLEFCLAAAGAPAEEPRRTTSPRQKRAETAEHPMVRRTMELFGAQITSVKDPEVS
jgi:DNA polymerase III subunit gamma/tau